MDVQIINPDNGNSPIPEAFYIVNLNLEELTGQGATNSATFTDDRLVLAPRQIVTNFGVFVKDGLAGGGIASGQLTAEIIQGGASNTLAVVSSILAAVERNYFGGTTDNVATSRALTTVADGLVTNVTFTTLTDSMAGACTPDAATAQTKAARISDVTVSSNVTARKQMTDFQHASNAANLAFTIDLDVLFQDLTAGNIIVYFWTKTLPSIAAGN